MSGEYKDLLNRIQAKYKRLSKGQKRIAEYILDNYDKVAFMTASNLGKTVGVSESTVVRFANALGYVGYPKLQKALQESIKTKLTTVQRLELSKDLEAGANVYRKLMNADVDSIRKAVEDLDPAMLNEIANAITSAKRVFVLGLRSSSVLANYLSFYLSFMMDNVQVVPTGAHDVFDKMVDISRGDVLIAITFPRYSNATMQVVRYAEREGATVIGVTDSVLSPIAELAAYSLYAKFEMTTFIDSLVAPMSVLNSLILAVSIEKRSALEEKFNKLESIWGEFNTYSEK